MNKINAQKLLIDFMTKIRVKANMKTFELYYP